MVVKFMNLYQFSAAEHIDCIYIEAENREDAVVYFLELCKWARIKIENPEDLGAFCVQCFDTIEQATGYARNCQWDGERFVEKQVVRPAYLKAMGRNRYQTVAEYLATPGVWFFDITGAKL